jgi:hypothetical protein
MHEPAFAKPHHIRSGLVWRLGFAGSAKQVGRHIPLPAVLGDDRDRLAIVARQNAFERTAPGRLKGDVVADAEFQHPGVCTHVAQHP